jgi:3-carboxy-cis,cis-muconate cycloisomerase
MGSEIFSGLFGRGGVAAEVGDRAWLRALLDFEAALAGALADAGLAAPALAAEIAAACRDAELDPARLGEGTAASGTPVPALLAALRERLSADAAAQLHRGATSQDAVDTAAMLVAKRALVPLLEDLDAAAAAAAELAERHRGTLQVGRTLLQQALPITFGLKAANWLAALDAAAARLAELREELPAQLGGGAGTLAALGDDGLTVAAALARRLELVEPRLPWHSNRVGPALLAGALGAAAGAAGKVGTDVALLAQTEVGEAAEGGGGGGSSTLPQKRNPVAAVAAVACARRTPGLVATMLAAMPGEHERAAGAWQAEAETLSELLRLTGSGAAAARSLLAELEVDPERMRANLELSDGLVMAEALATALGASLGRATAQELAQAASRRAAADGTSLAQAAAQLPEIVDALGQEGIAAALEPGAYLGVTERLIERALAAHRERIGARG